MRPGERGLRLRHRAKGRIADLRDGSPVSLVAHSSFGGIPEFPRIGSPREAEGGKGGESVAKAARLVTISS
jgi:hypothetical protein